MMATSVLSSHALAPDPRSLSSWPRPEQGRLNSLKSDIHSKGSLLSSTWNDLYRLLSQYQAELFVSDSLISSDHELRRDIAKKDAQLTDLQRKLNITENEIERVKLDVTVKNTLLQKYQDDLLEKEASLLECQATIRKLENKQQLLENRLVKQNRLSRNTAEREEAARREEARQDETIDYTSTSNTATTNSTIPEAEKKFEIPEKVEKAKLPKGSLIDASISAIAQKRKSGAHSMPSKRKSLTPTQIDKTPRRPTSEDLLQQVLDDVIDSSNHSNHCEVKLEPMEEQVHVQQTGDTVFPEPEEVEAPLEQFENWQNDALAQATGEVVTTHKRSNRYDPAGYPCPTCHRIFTRQTHRKRHIDTMHARVKRHHCLECGRAFARKDYLTKHFIAHHPELCGEFLCPVCGKKCLCQDEVTTHVYQNHSVFANTQEQINVLIAEAKEGQLEALLAKEGVIDVSKDNDLEGGLGPLLEEVDLDNDNDEDGEGLDKDEDLVDVLTGNNTSSELHEVVQVVESDTEENPKEEVDVVLDFEAAVESNG